MEHEFHLIVRGNAGDRSARIGILDARGVSVGSCADGSVTVAIVGQLGLETQAAQVASAWLKDSRNDVHLPIGGIGTVVLDNRNASVTAMAAPIGLRQMYWTARGDTFGVGSDAQRLGTGCGLSLEIQPDALFRYLYFHMIPGPSTVFRGLSKLDGGHQVRWSGRDAVVERYWLPTFEDQRSLSEASATQDLHEILRNAVERALARPSPAGAFLSGGLDSSTVAGIAARFCPGIPSITMGFEADGYDEMEYARIASRHFGTKPLEYYVTPDDVLSTLPMIAAAFPEPFGNSSAAAAYHCARIARENGIQLLLAGDGGDEIFGGNDRYAKQLVFERYGLLPSPLRKGLLEPAVNAAARVTSAFPFGKAASYVQQANVPLPDRLQSYNFLHRHEPAEVFDKELLAQVDQAAPLQLLREEYGIPDTDSAVNRMLFLDWKFTLHDNDLVKVNTMCQLAGVEVAYPMLDQALVDFSMRLPGDWKVHKRQLRWFYKRAMQDFLPREIIQKTKHGFGLPFGVWTRTHDGLRRLSEDALASLSKRRYFRPEFLQQALRLHREGHASYYGELVWILTVLELWLQRNMPNARL